MNLIESIVCPQDGAEPRKVLVFGTYTRIQALVDVLNARRLLANRQSWHGQTLSPHGWKPRLITKLPSSPAHRPAKPFSRSSGGIRRSASVASPPC